MRRSHPSSGTTGVASWYACIGSRPDLVAKREGTAGRSPIVGLAGVEFTARVPDMQLTDATIVFDLTARSLTLRLISGSTDQCSCFAGLKPMTVAELRPFIGYGFRVMLDAGLRHHGLSLQEQEVGGLHERFFAFYADHVAVASTVRGRAGTAGGAWPARALPSAPTSTSTCRPLRPARPRIVWNHRRPRYLPDV